MESRGPDMALSEDWFVPQNRYGADAEWEALQMVFRRVGGEGRALIGLEITLFTQ